MKKESFFLSFLFLCILIFPVTDILAFNFWIEDFETLPTDWEYYGYIREGHGHTGLDKFNKPVPSGFSVMNGILTSSFNYIDAGSGSSNTGNGNMSTAWHNNTVDYGTWNFNVFIDDWSSITQVFEINFLAHNPQNNFNYTGKIVNDLGFEYTGVALEFRGRHNDSFHEINFYYAKGYKNYVVDNSDFNSFHNIIINRNITGEFKIYFDSKLIISVVDNNTYNPQKFGTTVYYGKVKLDNVLITDKICSPDEFSTCFNITTSHSKSSPSFELYSLLLIPVMIIFKKRKKNKITNR